VGDGLTVVKAGERRIAVIIGACNYSHEVSVDLAGCRETVLHFSWNPEFDGKEHLNPFYLEASVQALKDLDITHVLHAGAVGVNDFDALLNDLAKADEAVRRKNEMFLRHPVLFYEKYSALLDAAGIKAISPADLFPKYAPPEGVFGCLEAADDLIKIATLNKARAEKACADAMRSEIARRDSVRIAYLPRTVLFEDSQLISIQETSTLDMLRKLPRKSKRVRRILMKVHPDGFPKNLDCPTLTPETVELAARRHIDLIAIDRKNGLLVNRDRTIKIAEDAGIVLLGF